MKLSKGIARVAVVVTALVLSVGLVSCNPHHFRRGRPRHHRVERRHRPRYDWRYSNHDNHDRHDHDRRERDHDNHDRDDDDDHDRDWDDRDWDD